MKTKADFKTLFQLFVSFLKVGAFTFGGGYAMIPIIQREAVEKRKWVKEEDIFDILAIAESTPGPIAVNASTYIGFKVAGFWGALFATFGLVLPSFMIIYLISLFYNAFMEVNFIRAFFKGLSVGVIVMLVMAFVKLKKQMKLNVATTIIFFVVLAYLVANYFIGIEIPFFTLILIFFGIVFGIVTEALTRKETK